MATHGVARYSSRQTRSEAEEEGARQRRLRKIDSYRALDNTVHELMNQGEYTSETLQKLSELLTSNPEYYTVWNYRRRVLRHQFSATTPDHADQLAALIKNDLHFLVPLLRSFPKCYWIWSYRLWLLDEAIRLLPLAIARKFWQDELALVGKMLSLDGRNFHGWGYRRGVVDSLENLNGEEGTWKSMAKEEFDYAKKMISSNLSNFSAWHYRTVLIQRLLQEGSASNAERKKMLDDELNLIHRALCDPYDQSLWFYHQNLMSCFDPSLSRRTMVPHLSQSERIVYLCDEIQAIEEMLDGAEDCKYVYQALIDCTVLLSKARGSMPADDYKRVMSWVTELKKLDPLRSGRWSDFERNLLAREERAI